jgi:hypothetical protein
MSSHVGDVKETMFQEATKSVEKVLVGLINGLEETIDRRATNIAKQLRINFESLILDQGVFKVFSDVKEETRGILLNADRNWENIYREQDADTTGNVSDAMASMSVGPESVATNVEEATKLEGDMSRV